MQYLLQPQHMGDRLIRVCWVGAFPEAPMASSKPTTHRIRVIHFSWIQHYFYYISLYSGSVASLSSMLTPHSDLHLSLCVAWFSHAWHILLTHFCLVSFFFLLFPNFTLFLLYDFTLWVPRDSHSTLLGMPEDGPSTCKSNVCESLPAYISAYHLMADGCRSQKRPPSDRLELATDRWLCAVMWALGTGPEPCAKEISMFSSPSFLNMYDGFEFTLLLLQPPKCWNYRLRLLYSALSFKSLSSY